MNKILILALLACAGLAQAGDATYVGGGRYSCSAKTAECAVYNANNRSMDAAEYERLRRDYEAEAALSRFERTLEEARMRRERENDRERSYNGY